MSEPEGTLPGGVIGSRAAASPAGWFPSDGGGPARSGTGGAALACPPVLRAPLPCRRRSRPSAPAGAAPARQPPAGRADIVTKSRAQEGSKKVAGPWTVVATSLVPFVGDAVPFAVAGS